MLVTHKNPKLKAINTAIFSEIRSCSFQTCGIGRIRIATSVAIVETAFAIHVLTWLMHRPGRSGYHSFWTGMQIKMKRKVIQITQRMTKVPMMYAHILKYGKRKIR